MKIEQGFQASLADLGLIRRVGSVPSGILEDIALDRRWHNGAVIALTNERSQHLVLSSDLAHAVKRAALGQRLAEIKRHLLTDTSWNRFIHQGFEGGGTHDPKHLGHLLGRGANVAAVGEVVRVVAWCRGHVDSDSPVNVL